MKSFCFIIYILIEAFITISIASEIGILYTLLVVLFTGAIGLFLFLSIPFKIAEIMNNVFTDFSLTAFGISTFLKICGAIMLILPGFFGDMIGVILVIGSVIFLPKPKTTNQKQDKSKNYNEEIIDVEIVEDNNTYIK